jgi:hypothetical protein
MQLFLDTIKFSGLLATLTDYQLYEIIQNATLDETLRKSANDEFNKRKLTFEEIQQIVI